jgi:hypothetical protein
MPDLLQVARNPAVVGDVASPPEPCPMIDIEAMHPHALFFVGVCRIWVRCAGEIVSSLFVNDAATAGAVKGRAAPISRCEIIAAPAKYKGKREASEETDERAARSAHVVAVSTRHLKGHSHPHARSKIHRQRSRDRSRACHGNAVRTAGEPV